MRSRNPISCPARNHNTSFVLGRLQGPPWHRVPPSHQLLWGTFFGGENITVQISCTGRFDRQHNALLTAQHWVDLAEKSYSIAQCHAMISICRHFKTSVVMHAEINGLNVSPFGDRFRRHRSRARYDPCSSSRYKVSDSFLTAPPGELIHAHACESSSKDSHVRTSSTRRAGQW